MAIPASATATSGGNATYAVDCSQSGGDYDYFYVAPGGTITLNLTNCDSYYTYTGSFTPAPVGGVPASTVVLAAGDETDFYDSSSGDYYGAYVYEAGAETVPAGTLLATHDFSMTTNADEITVADNTNNDGHFLDNRPECELEAYGSSAHHVYATMDITVFTAGDYTFRGISSSPAGHYIPFEAFDPFEDTFLALYSGFDPANPDNNVVGCNDDANDVNASNDAEYLSDGSIIEGHQPYFTAAALTPGQYTLVLLTWSELSTAELQAGYSNSEGDSFAVGTKTNTFQLWGPTGGLSLGHVSSNPSPASSTTSSADPLAPVQPTVEAVGASAATENGVSVPVTVTPLSDRKGVLMTGSGFTMQFVGGNSAGAPVELDSDGNIVVSPTGTVRVSGTGFAPNSQVKVYLFSTPTQLGTTTTDSSGSFSASFPLPVGIKPGVHTAQASGYTTGNQVRTLSLGVSVQGASLASTGFDATPLAAGGGIILLLGGALVVASRRRTGRSAE